MKIKTFLRWLKDSPATSPRPAQARPTQSEGSRSARTRETDAPAVQENSGHPESLASARFAKRIADMRRMPGLKPIRSPRTSR